MEFLLAAALLVVTVVIAFVAISQRSRIRRIEAKFGLDGAGLSLELQRWLGVKLLELLSHR